jgi:hypothetical protein
MAIILIDTCVVTDLAVTLLFCLLYFDITKINYCMNKIKTMFIKSTFYLILFMPLQAIAWDDVRVLAILIQRKYWLKYWGALYNS